MASLDQFFEYKARKLRSYDELESLASQAGQKVLELRQPFNDTFGNNADVKLSLLLFHPDGDSKIVGDFDLPAHSFLLLYVMEEALDMWEYHSEWLINFQDMVDCQYLAKGIENRPEYGRDLRQTIGNTLWKLDEMADSFTNAKVRKNSGQKILNIDMPSNPAYIANTYS